MRIRRLAATAVLLVMVASAHAAERVPGDRWMRFTDPAQAGFDSAALEEARERWEALPSAAFLVIADGAVVAAWGDVDRRFMCHSVRKSFLSALYGVYWDQGRIELNKSLADLGIDDEPDPLLEVEKQARILDLLKARSGVFHPAAYAGRTDSQPRGSQGPGRYFAYNNWDFNTLATILIQETGDDVFEAFDRYFGTPLGMEDWRVSDGYYHYERDKSKYPAYPFRMSARDAARIGLLFARDGLWGDERILSEHWVHRSSALYSIDSDIMGYGFMWWVLREPRFARFGAYAALGVGNQMIAVLPGADMVIVNRADTYRGEGTPTPALLDLIEHVLDARVGVPDADPELVALEGGPPDPMATRVEADRLAALAGDWPYPPRPLGLPPRTTVSITADDGHLVAFSEVSGTFALYLQPDGTVVEEDSGNRFFPITDDARAFAGFSDARSIVSAALGVAADGDRKRAMTLLALVENEHGARIDVGRAVIDQVAGKGKKSEKAIRALAEEDPRTVEAVVNGYGYGLLQAGKQELALGVFEMNTRVFPEAFNAWDSLGEVHMMMGHDDEAVRCYRRSLELNPDNTNADAMIARILEGAGE